MSQGVSKGIGQGQGQTQDPKSGQNSDQEPLAAAEAALRQGDAEAAKALAATSQRPEALLFLAMLATRSNDLSSARELLLRYLKARPNDPTGWYNLGMVAVNLGDLRTGAKAYCRALDIQPAHQPAQAGLEQLVIAHADSSLKAGQPQQALALLEMPQVKQTPAVLDARAVVLAAKGDDSQAQALSRQAVAAGPDNLRLRANLAALLSRETSQTAIDESESLAASVLEQQSDHAGALHCLAVIGQKRGTLDQALEYARRAVISQSSADHWMTLGDIQAVLNPADAAQTFATALEHFPNHPLLLRQQGISLLRASQASPALAALDRSLLIAPHDQRAIAHRAVALAASGEPDQADHWLGIPANIQRQMLNCPAGFESLAAFNAALAEDIANHSTLRWEPVGLAARNGGLTTDLLADSRPAIAGFHQRLREAIDALIGRFNCQGPFAAAFPGADYELNIWATLVHADGNIDTHIHEESWLSGAYYVQLPAGSNGEGAIEFGRPHGDLPQVEMTRRHVIEPAEGDLLLFPSYLFHRTLPHRSEQPRISVSFDVSRRQ